MLSLIPSAASRRTARASVHLTCADARVPSQAIPRSGSPDVKARVRSVPISSPLPAKTSHLRLRRTWPEAGRIYEPYPAFGVARSIMTSAVGRPDVRSARTLRRRGPVRPRPASPLPGRLAGWRGRPRRRFPFARARPRMGSLAGFQR